MLSARQFETNSFSADAEIFCHNKYKINLQENKSMLPLRNLQESPLNKMGAKEKLNDVEDELIAQRQISFFSAMLPGESQEGNAIKKNTTLPNIRETKKLADVSKKIMQLAELFLKTAREAAEDLAEFRYKKFDALIKNFGCQITALDVQKKVHLKIAEEANAFKDIVESRIEKLQEITDTVPDSSCSEMSMPEYLQKVGLDFEVSSSMADLVRLKLLNIVNSNKEVSQNGKLREVPYTNLGALLNNVGLDRKILEKLIRAIQIDEAAKAAIFIRNEAAALSNTSRSLLIQRLLNINFQRKGQSGIISLPLLYNTEAVIRSIQGIILIKNKLLLCDKPIQNAKPMQVFLKMPEERILSEEEVERISQDEPLIVIEGYISNDTVLDEAIQKMGLIKIINANCAILEQYADQAKNQHIDDEEAQQDLADYAKCQDAASIIEIDHIYCASIKEEMP